MKRPQKTVNIRLWKKTRDRLKIRAVKEGKTMMQLINELSLVKLYADWSDRPNKK